MKKNPGAASLKKTVVEQIQSGVLPPGAKLAGERTLAQTYGLSYLTARRAVDELVQNGYVERVPRSGTFVKKNLNYLDVFAKKRLIAFVSYDLNNPLVNTFLAAIEERAQQSNYMILVCNSKLDATLEAVLLRQLAELNIAGIIFCPIAPPVNFSVVQELRSKHIPIVTIDHAFADVDIDSVECDNFDAAYRATSYLISLGHRRIAHLTIPPYELQRSTINLRRFQGYRQALLDHGIAFDPVLVRHFSSELYHTEMSKIDLHYFGYLPALELLRLPQRPSAIFIYIDEIARGLYRAAKELQIKIPEELSVIGLNNLELCERLEPPLTSMAQPFVAMATRATEILISRMEAPERHVSFHEQLKTILIQRRSVSAPPATPHDIDAATN